MNVFAWHMLSKQNLFQSVPLHNYDKVVKYSVAKKTQLKIYDHENIPGLIQNPYQMLFRLLNLNKMYILLLQV